MSIINLSLFSLSPLLNPVHNFPHIFPPYIYVWTSPWNVPFILAPCPCVAFPCIMSSHFKWQVFGLDLVFNNEFELAICKEMVVGCSVQWLSSFNRKHQIALILLPPFPPLSGCLAHLSHERQLQMLPLCFALPCDCFMIYDNQIVLSP